MFGFEIYYVKPKSIEKNIMVIVGYYIFGAYIIMLLERYIIRKLFKAQIAFKSLWYTTFKN